MADDARLAELREQILTALEVAGPMTPYTERLLIGELLPVVSAWAEQESARRTAEAVRPFEELFSGGPDTACRTTWRRDSLADMPGTSTECCEVPMADLRDAFDRAAALIPATEEKL